jgi:hypothetical protein
LIPEAATFELCAVAHLIRPWGRPAQDLDQLCEAIASAPDEVIFRHAVQYQLRHPGAAELPPDDFSAWIGGVLQDPETAERLSFAVQSQNTSPASARAALLGALEASPGRRRGSRDAPEGSPFVFLSATSLSFPTGIHIRAGQEAVDALGEADASVWFFHLIEEPWCREGRASLLEWLGRTGDRRLAEWLEEAARSGLPIEKARAQLLRRWHRSRIARRLAVATTSSEEVRREAGRRAVARLVRRRPRTDESA